MKKNCPRCNTLFECRNENIMECDCIKIILSHHDQQYIAQKYDGCLCLKCLKEIKAMALHLKKMELISQQ